MDVDSNLTLIETRISELISNQFQSEACENLTASCSEILKTVITQAISSSEGGKRLRALLLLSAFDAAYNQHLDDKTDSLIDKNYNNLEFLTKKTAVIDVACALEVFQTAALIHDDIIDESSLRRGKPSAYCALSEVCKNKHIGTGLGLMLGDILATESFDITREASKKLYNSQDLLSSFADMQKNVGIGQVLDLSIELMSLDDPNQLAESSINVFRWKTASYTTIAPIELGLLAAGVDTAAAKKTAKNVGEPLGIAFQLADDLLDIVSDTSRTGKPIGGDIREGKRAVLLADALSLGNQNEKLLLKKAYESEYRNNDDVKKIIEIYYSTGAIEKSKHRIYKLWQETLSAIKDSPLKAEGKNKLISMAEKFIPSDWRI
ncbi:polyprenyl synthetase family protein [Gardnerella sp. 2492-Sm]|uniref:polyprenyl synthetase family protein n=1 Tax=unclassified Gardnerella TaxID=2628112 RepID=UPI003D02BA4C